MVFNFGSAGQAIDDLNPIASGWRTPHNVRVRRVGTTGEESSTRHWDRRTLCEDEPNGVFADGRSDLVTGGDQPDGYHQNQPCKSPVKPFSSPAALRD